MTKEITKAIILQQIQDRMKLRDFEPAKFLFDETVIPTFDIREEFQTIKLEFETKSITATGPVNFFQVPMNERWTLSRYDVVFMTGAFTAAGVYWRKHDSTVKFMYLDLTAAQNVSYHGEPLNPVILPPQSSINVNIDGYTSTGDLRLYIEFIKEEIR